MKYELEYVECETDFVICADTTDHLGFLCKRCRKPLEVLQVETAWVQGKPKDRCTWLWLACHNCKMRFRRKFYWHENCFNFFKEIGAT